MNLNEIKTSLENGVLVSKPTWEAVVEHALALTDQRTKMARLIVEKLAPRYVTDSNGPNAWACQCCLAEAKGSPGQAPDLVHDRDCEYISALWTYQAAVAQNSGAQAFNARAEAPNLLAKDRWDSNSVEAQFHKSVRFLTKREQGYVMGAFRDAILSTRGTKHVRRQLRGDHLEEVRTILEEITESPPTVEQCFERGYRHVCAHCSYPTTEHDDKCPMKRALNWLNPPEET